MRNIHNQNIAELVHEIVVAYTQGLGTCFNTRGKSEIGRSF